MTAPVAPAPAPSAPGGAADVRGRVCFVTANTFEFDSRTLRAARALAGDEFTVTVVALAGPGLPERETLEDGIEVRRPALDRRIASALRPLPGPVVRGVARLLGLDTESIALPVRGRGAAERIRAPLRRGLEILAYRRRVGPWAAAAVAGAPGATIYSAKALVALPVVRAAAHRTRARFVYDIADLHVESGRLARLPGPAKAYLVGRERAWMADAAGLTAVTGPLADEVVARYGVARPTVVLNCRPRWRPDEEDPADSGRLRAAVGGGDRPILLYQGAFREDQGLEELLAALELEALRDVPLVVACLGFGRLEGRLRAFAADRPGRLVVLPAVPSDELLDWTAGADLVLVGAPPRTRNLALTIPNKLFEALAAGVPVVVAGGTAVADLVAGARAGVVVEPWAAPGLAGAIAEYLAGTPAERGAARRRARTAALERYNWETEAAGLLELYRRVAAMGPAR